MSKYYLHANATDTKKKAIMFVQYFDNKLKNENLLEAVFI